MGNNKAITKRARSCLVTSVSAPVVFHRNALSSRTCHAPPCVLRTCCFMLLTLFLHLVPFSPTTFRSEDALVASLRVVAASSRKLLVCQISVWAYEVLLSTRQQPNLHVQEEHVSISLLSGVTSRVFMLTKRGWLFVRITS